jgi:uncharacterized Zn-binding protein involved in type VI secretion
VPGFLLHVGAKGSCPHGSGQLTVIPSSARVLLGGQPAATAADQYLVAGCPFTVPTSKPQPCVKVQWTTPAARVLVNGQPAVLSSSVGICQSPEQVPNGPPSILASQLRVKGT